MPNHTCSMRRLTRKAIKLWEAKDLVPVAFDVYGNALPMIQTSGIRVEEWRGEVRPKSEDSKPFKPDFPLHGITVHVRPYDWFERKARGHR